MHPIVVLGIQGQVGGELVSLLEEQRRSYRGVSQDEADFLKPDSVIAVLERLAPSVVINAAAYTAVDQAEKEPELAEQINAGTPGRIAAWCATRKIPLVHYSTDYVFNGEGTHPWRESDPTGPLSVYGKTKLAGEQAIQRAGGPYLIFRTSWVVAPIGKNFIHTMLRLGAEREELRIVSDQAGAPTLAGDLARATLEALDGAHEMASFPTGVYHACNAGETNWHEFAQAIFAEARARGRVLKVRDVRAIRTAEYPTPAKRPFNSRLSTEKLFETFGVRLRDWRDALHDCMGKLS